MPFSGQVYCLLFEKACTRKLVYGSRRFAKKCFHFGNIKYIYIYTYTHSRVSFCDGSFYDDSLLRHLSSRTEHSRLVAHHCRNSSVLPVLSGLLVLFRYARVSSFFLNFSAVLLTLNIPSLARQRCLQSWGPRRTPCFFLVISQLFDAVDYSNYVFWVSETVIP